MNSIKASTEGFLSHAAVTEAEHVLASAEEPVKHASSTITKIVGKYALMFVDDAFEVVFKWLMASGIFNRHSRSKAKADFGDKLLNGKGKLYQEHKAALDPVIEQNKKEMKEKWPELVKEVAEYEKAVHTAESLINANRAKLEAGKLTAKADKFLQESKDKLKVYKEGIAMGPDKFAESALGIDLLKHGKLTDNFKKIVSKDGFITEAHLSEIAS